LAEIQRRAMQATPDDTHEGAWCEYCPSQTICPSMRATLAALAREDESVLRVDDALRRIEAIRTLLTRHVRNLKLIKGEVRS
jgi:hypothetical protein